MVFSSVSSTLLSFVPRSLRVMLVVPTPERVTIEAAPRSTSAACPVCCYSSRRVHSFYRRVLHDLPWQGRPVTIHVVARRFHCRNRDCARRTFAERLADVPGLSAAVPGGCEIFSINTGLLSAAKPERDWPRASRLRRVRIPFCVSRQAAVPLRSSLCCACSVSMIGHGDAGDATARCW